MWRSNNLLACTTYSSVVKPESNNILTDKCGDELLFWRLHRAVFRRTGWRSNGRIRVCVQWQQDHWQTNHSQHAPPLRRHVHGSLLSSAVGLFDKFLLGVKRRGLGDGSPSAEMTMGHTFLPVTHVTRNPRLTTTHESWLPTIAVSSQNH